MKPLYQLTNEYLEIYNCSEESDLDFAFAEKIEAIDSDFETKALNIASLIKNLTLDIDTVDNVLLDLEAKKHRLKKKVDNLKEYLKFNMEKVDKKEIRNTIHDIRIALNPCSVKVVNQELIPDEYIRKQEILKPDLTKIKDDLKRGVVIEGVELGRSDRLVVK